MTRRVDHVPSLPSLVLLLVARPAQRLEVVEACPDLRVSNCLWAQVYTMMDYNRRIIKPLLQAALTQTAHLLQVNGSCALPFLRLIERFCELFHRPHHVPLPPLSLCARPHHNSKAQAFAPAPLRRLCGFFHIATIPHVCVSLCSILQHLPIVHTSVQRRTCVLVKI